MRSAARSIRSWYCSYISANNARSPSLSNTDKKHESIRYYPTLQPCEHSTTTTCVFLPASHHVSISLWTLFKKQSLHQSRVYQKSLYTNELSRTVCPFLYPRQLSAARRRQGGRLTRPRKIIRNFPGEIAEIRDFSSYFKLPKMGMCAKSKLCSSPILLNFT